MSETEKPATTEERLPDIFSSKSNNNQNSSKQSIKRRNEIIDEYIKSLDQKSNRKKELSISSDEDDKDPFSSKAIQNLKPLKKSKNKLILPNFQKREKLKSESSRNTNIPNPKNKTTDENHEQKNKKMIKKKNYSDNNIMNNCVEEKNVFTGKILNINGVNNNLNSKWVISQSVYNNYNNFDNQNCNLYKFQNKNNNNQNVKLYKERSQSHIKQSYNLYKEKLNTLFNKNINKEQMFNNKNKINNTIRGNHAKTQEGVISYKNSGINNLYNNIYKLERFRKRNCTAKIIKNNISIKENIKQNKKLCGFRINSTLNNQRMIENKRQTYQKLLKEKENPYGLDWINKILGKNTKEKVGLSKEFINGVPVIKLIGKHDLSKRALKKKLSEIEKQRKMEETKYNKFINAEAKLSEGELDKEYNLPHEILEQFNKNTKNFFKLRKDIIEKPDEEDQIIEQ